MSAPRNATRASYSLHIWSQEEIASYQRLLHI